MTEPDKTQPDSTTEAPARPLFRVRLGITLMVVSCVIWLFLLVVPFLPLSVAQKSALGGSVFVGVQVAWWGGAAIAGPTAVVRLIAWARRLWPGRRSSSNASDSDQT